ncbi:KilA-N domain-containing protein [Acinetobacter baumannii]|uniref:KilA-N domain-containing protein n=1 Tax=Acinetobacter baumannii TaxID=470 RepID=A0AAD2YSS5_ACIBA|nr:KilA-N domain-containing protein [Acinetobacter baumannii]EKT8441593.1 KilA-N domain-containing protein [Acinetobacter baumannii]EKT9394616.1 KilA-N domain-containing protein [Acinetobacter baumannii]EKU0617628.1 KilA-N domain-containing protein [Acinetobacter baumannii]EKU0621609.1 KilA-N domain-containing protein [Acinetobacter baumannii]EKU0629047.1 KilA-N domain-containing protein [Acinetobacter baumannii]
MTSLAQNFLNPNNKPLVIGDFTIRQDDEGRYCLNDLHKASGDDKKHFPAYFLRNQQTKDLIAEIELSNVNGSDSERYENLHIAVKVIKGGSDKQGTYVVKELVYAYAMWISPKFHLMVIRAYDSLVMEWLLNGKQTISPEQAGILYNIVHTRAKGNKNLIVQMWSRLKNHFKYSASYRELRAIHFEDAKHYLEVMDLRAKPEEKKPQDPLFDKDAYELVRKLTEAVIIENDEIVPVLLAVKMLDVKKFAYYSHLVVKANEAARDIARLLDFRNLQNEPLIDADCSVIAMSNGQRFLARPNWFNCPA